uniref:Uncharacterized protein n=1 Tax=Fagus sylvatica TaxID=28930 RepID=A0A2N9ETW6_FAGSY
MVSSEAWRDVWRSANDGFEQFHSQPPWMMIEVMNRASIDSVNGGCNMGFGGSAGVLAKVAVALGFVCI